MIKVSNKDAENYYKIRIVMIVSFLVIAFTVSFGVALFAEFFSQFSFMGMPLHYYMGAQGSVLVFIVLLILNAVLNDRLDAKYGVDDSENERIVASSGRTLDE
ncbi:DUF4212 domain-containing protein [Geomicrobium sp. JCM 19039]|uniref:DUF4212 domain-containing protein n=1 Tax=Geomicrobium sp. JCM 19039 TaxID=1460636 RepID=UPI00045F37AF|nr:sodium/substrate symporter small subunit [Geomicrobium sp. JCM 19039]GAK12495.1 sodium:solute symporter associated protein [Geomicrobium sp. JCM 19039]